MDFLKKHYEKVLLGVVLVGLAVGAAMLPWMIASERAAEAEKKKRYEPEVKALEPLNLTNVVGLVQRAGTPVRLDFTATNRLFNPVPWQKLPDGRLKKVVLGNETGIGAAVVTQITPLYTTIALSTVRMEDAGARYMILVEHEAAAKPADRRKKTIGTSLNERVVKEDFVIRQVKGPADNPTELILELTDTGERVSLSREKPYRRVDGYMADVKYPPDNNKAWTNLRVGNGGPGTAPIIMGNEAYIVVAINKNEVVMSARSNNKKTSIPFNPGM